MSDHISKDTEGNQTLFLNPPFVHSLSIAKDDKTFATGLGKKFMSNKHCFFDEYIIT